MPEIAASGRACCAYRTRFYANYAVRQLRWRVLMAGGPIETFSFEAHYQYARKATPAKIYEELATRVDRMWSRVEPSS